MDEETRSNVSALVTTGVSLAIGLGFDLSPDTVTTLSSFAPVLDRCVNRVLGLFSRKSFSEIECARLGICYSEAVSIVKKNLSTGKEIVMKDVLNEGGKINKADEVLEAIFKGAINDSQTIKSKLYGRLIGNFPFQNQYDSSRLYLMLKVAMDLSYDELCLLSVLQHQPATCYYPLEEGANHGSPDAAELFSYLMHFKVYGLLLSVAPFYQGRNLDSYVLSFLCRDLCLFLQLDDLNIEDRNRIRRKLQTFIPTIF